MHNAIITKYHGPGNVYGSRVSAQSNGKKIVLDWDHSIDAKENHIRAARELCRRNMWIGLLHSAPADKFFCHVFDESPDTGNIVNEIRFVVGCLPMKEEGLAKFDDVIAHNSNDYFPLHHRMFIREPNFSLRND